MSPGDAARVITAAEGVRADAVGDYTTKVACRRSNLIAARMATTFRQAIATSTATRSAEDAATIDQFLTDLGRQEECGGLL